MKRLKIIALCFALGLILLSGLSVKAQCAMCSATVESNAKNGNMQTAGLNNGIIYLLAAPYIAVGVVAYIWYTKYRRKNVNLQMRDEKLHLN